MVIRIWANSSECGLTFGPTLHPLNSPGAGGGHLVELERLIGPEVVEGEFDPVVGTGPDKSEGAATAACHGCEGTPPNQLAQSVQRELGRARGAQFVVGELGDVLDFPPFTISVSSEQPLFGTPFSPGD